MSQTVTQQSDAVEATKDEALEAEPLTSAIKFESMPASYLAEAGNWVQVS